MHEGKSISALRKKVNSVQTVLLQNIFQPEFSECDKEHSVARFLRSYYSLSHLCRAQDESDLDECLEVAEGIPRKYCLQHKLQDTEPRH